MRKFMYPPKKPQNNFVCDPEGPWGPVYDSSLPNERFVINYKFVDSGSNLMEEDQEAYETIQKLKKIFTQFKGREN